VTNSSPFCEIRNWTYSGLTDKKAGSLGRPQFVETRVEYGGDEEDRTPDLRIANATLSQLSYVPEGENYSWNDPIP
jgi:hypothetical protein